jgi:Nickel responsive protein SCO4226-like
MSDIIMERAFDEAIAPEQILGLVAASEGCFSIYGVQWVESFLSENGLMMVCRFSAADSETVRTAIRQSGNQLGATWPGEVHDAPPELAMNVVVERTFEQPVSLPEIQAIEDAGSWCLENHQVTFIRTFFSNDHKRMICFYHAPDAESVRLAQRQAKMPVDKVWACHYLQPA